MNINTRSKIWYDCYMKINIKQHYFSGGLWLAAWMFTIGFLNLSFGQGVIAILIWPFYLGRHFGI